MSYSGCLPPRSSFACTVYIVDSKAQETYTTLIEALDWFSEPLFVSIARVER